ncbi:hypothetical protein DVH05_025956 [Phytophthora capsici]|nr:hypothetical protein DVH05_025956 [Phytophthora capsici]
MEFSIATSQDESASIHERLLLHWVNSLPLTKCLLVEELRELRFGDVLVEIVQWLQDESTNCEEVPGGDALDQYKIMERLRRVVQFTAMECRSHDGDAMYIVNDAQCLSRLVAGESDAICAVLTVLRRLTAQRYDENDTDALCRRRDQEQMIENALHLTQISEKAPQEQLTKQKPKRVQPVPSRSRRIKPKDNTKTDTKYPLQHSRATKQSKKKPKLTKKRVNCPATGNTTDEKKVSDRTERTHSVGMLDPRARSERSSNDFRAKCFSNWAKLVLQVEMPLESWKLDSPRKIWLTFANGILLRRIAAELVRRCGGQLKCSTAEAKDLDYPVANGLAEKRRNFTFALSVFKELGISTKALSVFESMQRVSKRTSTIPIWNALDEVMTQAERLFNAPRPEERVKDENMSRYVENLSPNTQNKGTKNVEVKTTVNELSGCVPVKRTVPYVTSEQIHAVDEWLINLGFDCKKVSGRGVLQDSMRNGVLLCALHQQVKGISLSYFKTPRTLMEMRENISKAFERLKDLKIPQCYLTSSAEQAVLMGDRNVIYGILWHLRQVSFANIPKPKRCDEENQLSMETAPFKASPFLLDIPAVSLAGKGKLVIKDTLPPYQIELHDSFARRLAWSESISSDHDDDDDVFPVPKAPFCSPTYYEGKQMGDNVLPIRAGTSGSTQISSLAYPSDQKPPSIALGELSASVVKGQDNDSLQESPLIKLSQVRGKALHEPVEEILQWLKRLGIRLENISAFHDPNANLIEFQSGVLLCCIIEKVEFMRSIPGITRPSGKHPLSKASALHNITKALNILQQKKTMPLHLLRRANAIYTGNRDVILQLLGQIRKAYGHHHRRPKQHLSSAA